MIVLAIDGALGAFSAAVADGERCAALVTIPGNRALEAGLGAVQQVMHQAGVAPERIDRIAVGVGPGGFTGARIAISYAKSLALGWQRPACGVCSFDALEEGVRADPDAPLLCVVRGRPGVVSLRARIGSRQLRASDYTGEAIAQLDDVLRRGPIQLAGQAEDVAGALAERGYAVQNTLSAPHPAAFAIALIAARRETLASAHAIRADYGEQPAARLRA